MKGNDGFETAMNNLLKSNLADYTKKYLVLLPGDWPRQFFMCRIIYRKHADIEDPLLSLVPILTLSDMGGSMMAPQNVLPTVPKRLRGGSWNFMTFNVNLCSIKKLFLVP